MTTLISHSVSAYTNPQTSVRIRRDRANGLSETELRNHRRAAIQNWSDRDSSDYSFAVSEFETEDGETIIAYNFDIINGSPVEFIGTVVEARPPEGRTQQRVGITAEQVTDIHNKADEKASEIQNAGVSSNYSSSSPDDWSDWNTLNQTDWYTTDGADNTFGVTINYRENPADLDTHAVETEVDLIAAGVDNGDENDSYWQNHTASLKHDWKDGTGIDAELVNRAPGNTVGQTTSGWELAASAGYPSGGTFTLGYSESNQSPEIDIDDKSQPYTDKYVKHEADISGDVRYNAVNLNTASVAQSQYVSNPYVYNPTSVEINLEAIYKRNPIYSPPLTTSIDKNVSYSLNDNVSD
ncbi:hypothetical protein [Haloarchaeobius iranensis]|uniref:hypothetical protein n=1 Tax=Haloarchaeobius iranensis TaxID=996166 RepID=UPI001113AE63|nr:hypothetical protein [Haloarchaeobius iranensis]